MAQPSQRLYRRVADKLAERIQSGEFKPGDKLPGERELAETYEVSRPTIRESLIALEILELVEVRHGSGIYVAEGLAIPGDDGLREKEDDLDVGAFEILEARLLIETGVAGIVASSISDSEILLLEDIVERMKIMKSLEECEILDREFHVQLAKLTKNETIADFVANLWELRKRSKLYAVFEKRAKGAGREQRDEEHSAILDAIRMRNPKMAKAAMQRHLERVRQFLLDATQLEELESLRSRQKEAREALAKRVLF